MRIPFVGGAYEARSLNADAQRCVNLYLEMDNASPRAPLALYATPGTLQKATLGDWPVRAMIAFGNDSVIAVSGGTVYKIDRFYNVTELGGGVETEGPIGMASNGLQVLIVDGVGGYLANGTTLTYISDPDFPAGVTGCNFLSSYFVVYGDGTGQFYINEKPNDGSKWNGLDFATAEGAPDILVGGIANQLEQWLFGQTSVEIWVLTGNADFPLQRSGNAFVEQGCASGESIAKLDNTVFWLGRDDRGAGIVWKAQGYTPARISTHAIENAIQGYSTIADARAFTYQQGGHGFYVLTFPTADATWVYDVASNTWHARSWRDPNLNSDHRWRANCHAFMNNVHLVGDFENGKVYALDRDTYTDNGDPIRRLRATQCLDSDAGERLFYASMQVDLEAGVGIATGQGSAPLLMLRFSNDGGHTWSNERTATIGAAGAYRARAKFFRLGAGRNRVWEISLSDPVKLAVSGAYANFTKGEN